MWIAKRVEFLDTYLMDSWFVLLMVKLSFLGNTKNTLAAISAWPQPVWTV